MLNQHMSEGTDMLYSTYSNCPIFRERLYWRIRALIIIPKCNDCIIWKGNRYRLHPSRIYFVDLIVCNNKVKKQKTIAVVTMIGIACRIVEYTCFDSKNRGIFLLYVSDKNYHLLEPSLRDRQFFAESIKLIDRNKQSKVSIAPSTP
jgi:hypothetical protein